jgi:hypothetical protein
METKDKSYMPKFLLFIFCFILLLSAVQAQTVVSGRVIDAETETGISFATIFLRGPDTTVSTDFDGYYKLLMKSTNITIGAKCIGYQPVITTIKRASRRQTINFELDRIDTLRHKTVLKKSESAALNLMYKVIMNKGAHNKKTLNSYGYEAYTKIQVDLIDLTERFRQRKLFKPYQFFLII